MSEIIIGIIKFLYKKIVPRNFRLIEEFEKATKEYISVYILL